MRIREAIPADNEELQHVMGQCSQGKSLRFTLINRPDFFARARAYEHHKVFVLESESGILSSMACALRQVLINGILQPVGYEFQLFTLPDQRRQGLITQLRHQVEEYLREHSALYTSAFMVPDNAASISLYENSSFCMHRQMFGSVMLIYKPISLDSRYTICSATQADLPAAAQLLNQIWSTRNFYTPMTAASLSDYIKRTSALSLDQFLLLKDQDELLACGAIWDWSQIMEIWVHSLNIPLRLIAKGLDIVRAFRPMPRLPQTGDKFRQWGLALLAFKQAPHLEALLREVNNRALQAGIEQVIVAICERDKQILRGLRGYITVSSPTNFYVKALQPQILLDQRPVFADILDF